MKAYLNNIVVVGQGMFPNEVIVQYYDSLGRVLSGFFDKQFVKEGKLEVNVLFSNSEQTTITAPQQGFLERNALLAVPGEEISME
ncbi:MAG: hypothetical protein AABX54_02485 [Nanoarchaeota archaeon]